MIVEDLERLYPTLIPFVKIRIIELMDHVLGTYDRAISDFTAREFKRSGTDILLCRTRPSLTTLSPFPFAPPPLLPTCPTSPALIRSSRCH